MINRYLDPKIDLAFKRVFGEHKNLLQSFLNAMLPLAEDAQIEDLEYLTSEQVPELPGLFKNSIVDVKCRDTQGRTFIVEMQMLWTASFEQRILFSASQAYVKQMRIGQDYAGLQPVYALALTNQVFDKYSDEYYHHYQIVNLQTPQRVLKGLEFVFIEIPKFKPKTRTDRLMQAKWLRFLSEVGGESPSLDPELRLDPDIAQALSLVEIGAYSETELDAYHIHMDKLRIESTIITDAKAEGRAEGMQQGELQALKRLLTKKFGALTADLVRRLEAGDTAQIEVWFDRAVDAADLHTVFKAH
jgi:predicted transposase/invertase (TIGR01784 family)